MGENICELQEMKMYELQLAGLAGTMEGSQYVVDLTMIGFILKNEESTFTLELLKELFIPYPTVKIDGILETISFENVQATVNHCLSLPGGSCDYDAIQYPEARALVFWDIVQRALEYPPDVSLRYVENKNNNTFGAFWPMWDFCFILIKQKRGFIFICGAGPY